MVGSIFYLPNPNRNPSPSPNPNPYGVNQVYIKYFKERGMLLQNG